MSDIYVPSGNSRPLLRGTPRLLDAARDAPELITVNACPVRVKENGEEIYLDNK